MQQQQNKTRTGQWTRPNTAWPAGQEPPYEYNQQPPRPPPPPVAISTTTKNKLQKFQFKPPRSNSKKTDQQPRQTTDEPPHQPACAEGSKGSKDDTMTGSAAARDTAGRASGQRGTASKATSKSASRSASASELPKEATTTSRVPTKPAAEPTPAGKSNEGSGKENDAAAAADLPSTQPDKIVPPASATPEFLSIHVKTPRARFVWQDLAGTPATPRIRESLGISPNAKLSWMPDQAQAEAQAQAAGLLSPEGAAAAAGGAAAATRTRQGAKRTRSSSPPSSPTKPRSKRVAENVKKFKEVMASAASANMGLESKYHPRRRNALARHRTEVARSTTTARAGGPGVGGSRDALGMDIVDAAGGMAAGDDGVSPRSAAVLRRSASCNIPTKRQRTCSVEGSERPAVDTATGQTSRGPSREPVQTKASSPAMERLSLDVDDALPDDALPDTESIGREPRADSGDKADDDEFGDDVFDDDVFDDDVFDDDVLAELDASLAAEAVPTPELPALPARANAGHGEAGRGDAGCGGGGGVVGDMEDMFGDDFGDDFDFEAAELAATQAIKSSATPWANSQQGSSHRRRAIQRYLVTSVFTSSYEEHGRSTAEKILVLRKDGDKSGATRTLHLRGDWFNTSASVKAYVHVLGEFNAAGACVVDNEHNMVILHPDQLVSSTVVADSFECTRRAVLQDRVKATSEASAPLVYGTLLHEIFQEALMANQWDTVYVNRVVDQAIQRHIEDLYTIRVEPNAAREYLLSKTVEMQAWAKQFVGSRPKAEAVAEGRDGNVNLCVSKLLDVEEHVWSPMYGLKGNIDATVQVTMHPVRQPREAVTLTVPFELKTGKHASAKHRAQTVLYNMLLSDRYDLEIVYGVLYYMETSQTLRIPTVRTELRHMIMERNELACYIRERSVQLPPMLRKQHACGRCFAQTSCFVYHKLADGGDGASSGMDSKFDEVVGHLTPRHKEFFLKWEDLLTREEKEGQKLRRELWTMLSAEREKLGRCFGDVVIQEGSAQEDIAGSGSGSGSSKINRFRYTFRKASAAPGFSFMDSQLAVGEPIVVSDEDGHFALALGFVTAVHKGRIDVAVDRRLHNARVRQDGFDEQTNQVFAGIMETSSSPAARKQGKTKKETTPPPLRYRLDKDEFSNGMATVRNNLVQVMAGHRVGLRETRELVVDLVPPKFKVTPTQYSIGTNDDGTAAAETLNIDQQRAIAKVMSAQDYALVLGMPGTGKTTTIAHIIRALVGQGKSVLLTSYTHTAVDNILLKLKTSATPVLRLGAPAKVHDEVRSFAILAGEPKASFEAIRHAWHDTPVVATTCLGINHALFSERVFDYCIVDEASQITLPICLGPIRMARTFVLVGDHNQLPPLVRNEEARAGGLDVSLFRLLSATHPGSVVNLEHQYRMCEDIMTLSNELIYGGRLKCGTDALRHRSLHVPDMAELWRHHHNGASVARLTPRSYCAMGGATCWLRDLLRPETRVAFCNTDAVEGSREEAKGNRTVNPCEARLTAQVVDALLTVGVPAADIGVMTPYRSQLALLKHQLRDLQAHHGGAIEMHTADRFQGRDKEVVVLSLVRSNEQCNIGELLKDWRRINVAFTRAKTKLLVVGSRSTLQGAATVSEAAVTSEAAAAGEVAGQAKSRDEAKPAGEANPGMDLADDDTMGEQMLARFVRLMDEHRWIYDLPRDALENHLFEDYPTTQAAASASHPVAVKAEPGTSDSGTAQPLQPTANTANKKTARPGKPSLLVASAGKENRQPLKRTGIKSSMLLKGKPILQGILDDVMGGG